MKKILTFSLFITAAVLFADRAAHATAGSTAGCVVSTVSWDYDPQVPVVPQSQGGTGTPDKWLSVICTDNTVHIAYLTTSLKGTSSPNIPCPLYDIETLKLWHSTALAAKLSGRPLTIFWNSKVCAGSGAKNNITDMFGG